MHTVENRHLKADAFCASCVQEELIAASSSPSQEPMVALAPVKWKYCQPEPLQGKISGVEYRCLTGGPPKILSILARTTSQFTFLKSSSTLFLLATRSARLP
eukprot:TRINITY_DN7259_c1_g1_i1.p1 TRINITY_DN7259_c1_g1~~TRINITY_DN7259_c1_g1_i1.p1  ORF type:complete len:102 (+),score=5.40 TRINITY_DN7259_c1_g1_i1:181-486(+)